MPVEFRFMLKFFAKTQKKLLVNQVLIYTVFDAKAIEE